MRLRQKKRHNILGVENHRRTLRGLLFTCLVVSALCVGISTLFYQMYEHSLVEEMIASSARTLDATDILIAEVFEQIESVAYQQTLVTARLINESDKDIIYDYYRQQQLTSALINMKNSHSYIHSTYVYFNQGSMIVTSFMGITSFRLFYDTAWLDVYSGNSGEKVWINGRKPYDPQYENMQHFLNKYHDDNSEVLTLLVPLSSSLQNKGGVIVVNVYESEIAKLLNEGSGATKMLMEDDTGRIILSSDNERLSSDLSASIFSSIKEANQPHGSFNFKNEGGEEFICVYSRSRFNGNYILELLTLSNVLQPVTSLFWKIILYAAMFLAVSIALVLLLVYFSYRPVRQLYKELGKYVSVSSSDTDIVMFQKSINKLIQENKTLTSLWENNRVLIKHRTLSLLLQGKVSAFDSDPKRLEFLEIRFPHDFFACCVLHLDMPPHPHIIFDEQHEVIKMHLFSITQQCMVAPVKGYTVDLDDLNVALILNVADDSPRHLLNLCQQIQQAVADSEIIPYTLSIGIGNYLSALEGTALSFQQACIAMRYAVGNCPGEVISFSSISVSHLPAEWGGSPEENELLDAVRIGDMSTAIQSLNKWFDKLLRSELSFEERKKIIANHVVRIITILPEIGIAMVSSATGINDKILSLTEFEQIQFFVTHFIEDICSQIQVRREHKNAETIEKVISYIQQNYAKEISLTQVAEGVYMSVPYLCKIFKEYTQKTFNDYLTTLRVEASVSLLQGSTQKIKDIAENVGYTNTQSYIRAFKKHKHMTPSEFRESFISKNLR